jgi:hypothetical protein
VRPTESQLTATTKINVPDDMETTSTPIVHRRHPRPIGSKVPDGPAKRPSAQQSP